MAKSRLSPVDETADDWGFRYGSCLLRSQYAASARCRARLIHVKRSAGRRKDSEAVAELEALRDEQREQNATS